MADPACHLSPDSRVVLHLTPRWNRRLRRRRSFIDARKGRWKRETANGCLRRPSNDQFFPEALGPNLVLFAAASAASIEGHARRGVD